VRTQGGCGRVKFCVHWEFVLGKKEGFPIGKFFFFLGEGRALAVIPRGGLEVLYFRWGCFFSSGAREKVIG